MLASSGARLHRDLQVRRAPPRRAPREEDLSKEIPGVGVVRLGCATMARNSCSASSLCRRARVPSPAYCAPFTFFGMGGQLRAGAPRPPGRIVPAACRYRRASRSLRGRLASSAIAAAQRGDRPRRNLPRAAWICPTSDVQLGDVGMFGHHAREDLLGFVGAVAAHAAKGRTHTAARDRSGASDRRAGSRPPRRSRSALSEASASIRRGVGVLRLLLRSALRASAGNRLLVLLRVEVGDAERVLHLRERWIDRRRTARTTLRRGRSGRPARG